MFVRISMYVRIPMCVCMRVHVRVRVRVRARARVHVRVRVHVRLCRWENIEIRRIEQHCRNSELNLSRNLSRKHIQIICLSA